MATALSVCADEEWPPNINRAWLIETAKVVGEGDDPAAKDNLLLLVGQRLYLLVDRNIANGHDYSESPMLLEKGYRVFESKQNGDTTIAYAHHNKNGDQKIALTPLPDNELYLLRIEPTGNANNPIQLRLHYELRTVDQDLARRRLKRILATGELHGVIAMKPLNAWLSNE